MKILLFSNWLPQKSTSSLFTFLTPLLLHKKTFKIFWGNVCFTLCTSSYLATWPNSTLVLFLHILVFDPWHILFIQILVFDIWYLNPWYLIQWYLGTFLFMVFDTWFLVPYPICLQLLLEQPSLPFSALVRCLWGFNKF